MSDFIYLSAANQDKKIIYDMAKVNIKSEKYISLGE